MYKRYDFASIPMMMPGKPVLCARLTGISPS